MVNEEYKKMGAKIKYYRQLLGQSQSVLADRVGISAQYLSRIECGRQMPSMQVLILIAENLNVNLAVLVSKDNV